MDAKQIARYAALGALFLVPLTPLLVANSLFFPFITGKAFYFRVLAEVAFAAWVVLALADARYRPRFSWVEISVLAFVGWMLIANLFAPNVEKAFWSNFERMEGWVLLAHLAAFFMAASSVLSVEGKWRAWFLTSLGVSVVVLCYALLQATGNAAIHQGSVRVDASFGNSIYLAVYLLFNTFIAGWLAFTEERPWLKWSLLALAGVSIIFIFLTQTRGTILALVGALGLAAVLTMIFSGGTARRVAAGGLAGLILVVGGFMAIRGTDFAHDNDLLRRLSQISLADGQVRFTLWGMAWQGVLERPVTGWGQEGFNYVFNKYYDPSLFAQEPWFDRAHNAFVDWLSAGGLPALVLYIALFVIAIISLWRSALPRAERVALTCLIAAYAFHNVFVFDNLYSYVYFFAVLAVIASHAPRGRDDTAPVVPAPLALGGATAALLAVMYFVNVPGYTVASNLIRALSSNDVGERAAHFERLSANPSFAKQEVREQYVNFALQVAQASSIPNEVKLKVAMNAIKEMENQVAAYPEDARGRLQLSLAYRTVGNVEGVLRELDAALALSPKKEQILIQKGLTFFELGRLEEARDTLEIAYSLGPQFPEIAKYAALGNFAAGDTARASEILAAHPEVAADVEAILKQLSASGAQ